MTEESNLSSYETAKLALTTLIVLVSIISLLSSLENRCGSNKPCAGSRALCGYFLGATTAVGVLYQYHLISFFSMNVTGKNVYRLDCLHSRKGGKRPLGAISDEYRNPCNVGNDSSITNSPDPNRNSTDVSESNVITADIRQMNEYHSTSLCTTSKMGTKKSKRIVPEPFISTTRDCERAQRGLCSLSQPCTPCEISRFREFHNSQHGWSRCQTCALSNRYGDCSFVDGVGPYCWKDADFSNVVPCRKCCTDGVAVFDDDGVCH